MTAKFAAYWNVSAERHLEEWVAMYKDQVSGSHISGATLMARGEGLPLTPDFNTWKDLVGKKKRCVYCWTCIRNIPDFFHHMKQHELQEDKETVPEEKGISEVEMFLYPFDNHTRMDCDY